MSALNIATVAMLVLGLILVLRAVALVTLCSGGRFRFDPLVSVLLGFTLILLGVALLP